jgi:hypothetical protein
MLLYVFRLRGAGPLPARGKRCNPDRGPIDHVVIWSFMLFGVTMVFTGVVRSTGAVYPPLAILFIAFWVIRIPAATLLVPRFGADAIWWSFPMGPSPP